MFRESLLRSLLIRVESSIGSVELRAVVRVVSSAYEITFNKFEAFFYAIGVN